MSKNSVTGNEGSRRGSTEKKAILASIASRSALKKE
jgi:hypothetical protein